MDEDLPSRSFAGVIKGELNALPGNDEVFPEQEETRVIRNGDWVLFKRFTPEGAPALGDALYNLADDPAHAEMLTYLTERLEMYFAIHARPEADLWRGGQPIRNSTLQDYWKDIWGPEWAPVYSY